MMDELEKLLSAPLKKINNNGFCEKNAQKVALHLRRRQLVIDGFSMLMAVVVACWLVVVDAFSAIKNISMQWYQQLAQNSFFTLPSSEEYPSINLPELLYQPSLLFMLFTMVFLWVITTENN